jgi:hyperosmotically inducible protein
MNRTIAIVAVSAVLSMPAIAWAQEAMSEPQTEETPAVKAGEEVSDAWITTKVKTDLMATGDVPGTGIEVETKDGVVTLTGEVESQAVADKAKSVAGNIKGVKRVDSQLTVRASTP